MEEDDDDENVGMGWVSCIRILQKCKEFHFTSVY
jgi:hypothetical protein